jgi:hypothetical protein
MRSKYLSNLLDRLSKIASQSKLFKTGDQNGFLSGIDLEHEFGSFIENYKKIMPYQGGNRKREIIVPSTMRNSPAI